MTTYEGRPLARPDEHIEDQGLAFDLGTLFGRRHLLRAVGLGGAALAGLAACGTSTGDGTAQSGAAPSSAAPSSAAQGSTTAETVEIPDETAGPYPGDGSNGPNVLTQSGIVRADIRSSFGGATQTAEGVALTIELTIVDLAGGGTPFAGTAVYVWHCDRAGRYSLYSQPITDQNYLRGVQIADAAGTVRFTSIFPACYSGRWPHIHFEVYRDQTAITAATNAIATSQVALPKAACDTVYATSGYEASVTNLAQVSLARDNVFGDDSAAHQLGTVTGSADAGYTVALTVPVDTRTAPTGGGAPPGSR
ncbi:3,4-dioxygenase subunit beta [Dactylosporangium salmoneum]|uniref:Intradiol ring-cleavage dioxygenase n=1 Tax=Dactylosporangium salmoneum TaxID=53361 RepID=A0ABN3GWI5_9ACTN